MQIVTESGIVIGDANIVEESLSLQESICSETHLRFGTCEASVLKIRLIAQASALTKQKITTSLMRDGELYQLGKYKVDSDKPTADRLYRDIVAYDAMYDIINAEVSGWYNGLLPNADSTVTLKEFRDSFFAHFGVEQEDVELINDSMTVTKTIEPSKLSGKTVITAICEINGCFGHIGRDGRFKYVFLQDTSLYPAETLYPADDLFPAGAEISASRYIRAEYEDYTTALINKLQIRQEEDDIGCIYGTGDNCYIIQDNFLVYGKSGEELNAIAENLYPIISTVTYQPMHVEAKGNPCLEVGDGIRLSTRNGTIMSYILQRTLKGIQALRDTYDAEGQQYQTEKVNSVHESIIQLKGKTNRLTRTVEETRLEISDAEKGLSSRITQNAGAITTEVARAKTEEGRLSSLISQTVEQVRIEVTERTSMYNEQVNTLQGGMAGSINLTFFEGTGEIVNINNKQAIFNNGNALYQDISLPAGTYLFTYEWLRNGALYINASVALHDMSISSVPSSSNTIYSKDLGSAWPTLDTWTKESFEFTLDKTKRIRFVTYFEAPWDYPDRPNSLYLTNLTLFGTAQSVADAIADVKSELILQSDKIEAKVEKNGVIAAINLTSENATIQAKKIDLVGLVSATEFTTKYATITSLNAATAEINTLKTEKLSASQFTASNINAMGIVAGSVDAENITGTTISGKTLIGGEIRSNNYGASSSAYTCGNGMRIDLTNGNIWWENGSIKAATGFMNSIGYEVPSSGGGYNLNFKSALAVASANHNTMVLGAGYSSIVLPSGANVTSLVDKKTNIIPCVNALSAIDNTDVYYFNYKNDNVKRDGSQKVGFIIGDGYNLDARLLSEDGDAIDTYNAIALNWRATQQLYEKIKKQQQQINEILQSLTNQEVAQHE